MKAIDNYNFFGKKALIRVDFNVPLNDNFQVTDDTRIKAALPTIHKVLADKGSVILLSHLGRPKDGYEEKFSLKHILPNLAALLNRPVKFSGNCIEEEIQKQCDSILPEEILLLENLRFHKEEKEGDHHFAQMLSLLGDVYINDAFGTAHRAHASTTIIAEFFPQDKLFGYLIEQELENIEKVVHNAQKPITAILGGAKISDKIEVIQSLLNKVDFLLIGGGMVFTFIKAMGGQIGSSIVEEDKIETAKEILDLMDKSNAQLILPSDAVVANEFSNHATTQVVAVEKIPDGWMGLDIGPQSIAHFKSVIRDSKTIFWNGPMGVFEMASFKTGTKEIAEEIAEETQKNGLYSLVGGGDSVAALNQFGLGDRVSYISTGGGALLEYIEGKTLPGIAAINN